MVNQKTNKIYFLKPMKSFSNWSSYNSSLNASTDSIYSDYVEDKLTVVHFLLGQEIGSSPFRDKYPLVDL